MNERAAAKTDTIIMDQVYEPAKAQVFRAS